MGALEKIWNIPNTHVILFSWGCRILLFSCCLGLEQTCPLISMCITLQHSLNGFLSHESDAEMSPLSDSGLEKWNICFHRWEFYRWNLLQNLWTTLYNIIVSTGGFSDLPRIPLSVGLRVDTAPQDAVQHSSMCACVSPSVWGRLE